MALSLTREGRGRGRKTEIDWWIAPANKSNRAMCTSSLAALIQFGNSRCNRATRMHADNTYARNVHQNWTSRLRRLHRGAPRQSPKQGWPPSAYSDDARNSLASPCGFARVKRLTASRFNKWRDSARKTTLTILRGISARQQHTSPHVSTRNTAKRRPFAWPRAPAARYRKLHAFRSCVYLVSSWFLQRALFVRTKDNY